MRYSPGLVRTTSGSATTVSAKPNVSGPVGVGTTAVASRTNDCALTPILPTDPLLPPKVAVTVAVCGGSVSRLSAIIALRLPADQRHRRRHDVAPARRQRDGAVEAAGRGAVLIERLQCDRELLVLTDGAAGRQGRRQRERAGGLVVGLHARAAGAVLPRRARVVRRWSSDTRRRRRRAVAAAATAPRDESARTDCARASEATRDGRSRHPSATATAPWSASAPPCRSCCRADRARSLRPRTAPPRRSSRR